MAHDRPRWRFRIRTLMLPIIIMALALALVGERWKRAENARRSAEAALMEAGLSQAALQAKAQAEVGEESEGSRQDWPNIREGRWSTSAKELRQK
jgi:hypothetical protein